MADDDSADPNDPNTLVVPFVFVPRGHPPPTEWLAAHPGWIRFPATMIPREPAPGESGPQWSVQIDFPGEPGAVPASAATEPATAVAAGGSAGIQQVACVRPAPALGTPDFAQFAPRLPGFQIAQAEEPTKEEGWRSAPNDPARDPAEELRLTRFNAAIRQLRELEPQNQQLSFIRDRDKVPDEAWVEALEREVREAHMRQAPPLAVPERSGLSMRDIVAPGGVPVGWQEGRARSFVRTVTPQMFQDIKIKLEALAGKPGERSESSDRNDYNETWYRLPDGTGFGLRMSKVNGWTIDFDDPALPKGFRIHQK
jgi:hypothetical protein